MALSVVVLPGSDGEVVVPVEAAHFILSDSGEFEPTRFAGSHWGDDHLNGPAVVSLAARTLELHYGSPDFMPTRLTVDLLRAARSVPTAVTFRAVRDGRRVRSAECELAQEGRPIARAALCSSGGRRRRQADCGACRRQFPSHPVGRWGTNGDAQ